MYVFLAVSLATHFQALLQHFHKNSSKLLPLLPGFFGNGTKVGRSDRGSSEASHGIDSSGRIGSNR